MPVRMQLGRALIAAGRFLESLAVVVMRPEDMLKASRRRYAQAVAAWNRDTATDARLTTEEQQMLAATGLPTGSALIVGAGGGREALALAQAGWRVTAIDIIPETVAVLREQAARRGLTIAGEAQAAGELNVAAGSFDLVWLTGQAYSRLPGRARRLRLVRRVAAALRPGGCFVAGYRVGPGSGGAKGNALRKALAYLTLGNTSFQPGDMLVDDGEFLHTFRTAAEVRAELGEGELPVVVPRDGAERAGRIVARKPVGFQPQRVAP